MSDRFQSNDPVPDPVPAQRPMSRPPQPQDAPPGSKRRVRARQGPPSPAGKRRGDRHHVRVPARTPVACRPTDLPPPVMHYDACGSGSPAGAAPAGKPSGCLGPTFYHAGPGVRTDAWTSPWPQADGRLG
jgi:hypothetical protein